MRRPVRKQLRLRPAGAAAEAAAAAAEAAGKASLISPIPSERNGIRCAPRFVEGFPGRSSNAPAPFARKRKDLHTVKIALEEAFTAPGLEKYLERTFELVTDAKPRAALQERLEDLADRRIAAMDEAGIDLFVLS